MNKVCCSDPKNSNYTLDKSTCSTWDDNKTDCYKYEVCKNKQYSQLVNKIENNHSGADERYANTKKQYEYEIMKTINITSGIAIFAVATIYMMNGGIQKV
jgi:type IV secretory pathway VirB6-like protein